MDISWDQDEKLGIEKRPALPGLIVISTNNGWEILDECLRRYQQLRHDGWKICVGDTGSTDPKFKDHAMELCHKYDHLYIGNNEPLYDFGIISIAFEIFREKFGRFFFHHDSVWCKSDITFQVIDRKLDEFEFVPWLGFARSYCPFDNERERQWCIRNFGSDVYDEGVFGSNLGIRTEALARIWPSMMNVKVWNKEQQCGMERGWGIVSQAHRLTRCNLEGLIVHGGDWHRLSNDGFMYFNKHFRSAGPRV